MRYVRPACCPRAEGDATATAARPGRTRRRLIRSPRRRAPATMTGSLCANLSPCPCNRVAQEAVASLAGFSAAGQLYGWARVNSGGDLLDRGAVARQGRAAHVAHLVAIEAAPPMHGGAVVPDHDILLPPG